LRAYANRWGVAAGDRVAVFTNNDDGLRTAKDLQAKGVDVVAGGGQPPRGASCLPGIRHLQGAQVVDSAGRLGLKSITVRTANGKTETIALHALGRFGRVEPECEHHLASPVAPRLERRGYAAFVPGAGGPAGLLAAGARRGICRPMGRCGPGRLRRAGGAWSLWASGQGG
jgi:hypothetical protein